MKQMMADFEFRKKKPTDVDFAGQLMETIRKTLVTLTCVSMQCDSEIRNKVIEIRQEIEQFSQRHTYWVNRLPDGRQKQNKK